MQEGLPASLNNLFRIFMGPTVTIYVVVHTEIPFKVVAFILKFYLDSAVGILFLCRGETLDH